jgi:regulator of protease activity HflC (stomatin/prohibitin superfamily)
MAWNQPSDKDKPRARAPATRGKGLNDALKRLQRRFDDFGSAGGPKRVAWVLLAMAPCVWAASGLYRIEATERAVVQRFGRVDVDTPKSVEFQSRQHLYVDPRKVLLATRDVYARAWGASPEFAAFYRSLQAYRATLGREGDVLVLTPDGDFFKYLHNPARH